MSDLFRKESLEKLNSPDNLSEYLKVTNIPVWIILIVLLLVVIGLLVWGVTAEIADGVYPIDFLKK